MVENRVGLAFQKQGVKEEALLKMMISSPENKDKPQHSAVGLVYRLFVCTP